ncbi:MAG: hypothetical protein WCI11_17720 [Candidatus Methylumidiphilus sp.]
MSAVPILIKYNKGQKVELEEAIEDFTAANFTIREVSNDGKGNIVMEFTPPDGNMVAAIKLPPSPTISSGGNLAWGAKVSAKFKSKVQIIAANIGCDPDFLMAAMAFETGETFSPDIKNSRSGATGLIQFMPKTAIGLGTTTNNLAKMTAEAQLDYVADYFANQKGKLNTLEDVYMAILWPSAVGKANNHVLFTDPSVEYNQNKGLDLNKDGSITKAEAASKVNDKLIIGRKPSNLG